ncbi:hypothetical protein GCM10009765_25390 [Fodinicola feengrottensis]|uniref:Peptidase inhibitor I78 family protein n=1 Tax=Fodinicola feengrottensis TaxID=435914 RepID=A0ABN2GQ57_9ACTN
MNVKIAIGAAVAVASVALLLPATAVAAPVDRCLGTIGMQIDDLRASRPAQQIQAIYPGELATTLYIKDRITVNLDDAGYVQACRLG